MGKKGLKPLGAIWIASENCQTSKPAVQKIGEDCAGRSSCTNNDRLAALYVGVLQSLSNAIDIRVVTNEKAPIRAGRNSTRRSSERP